MGLARGFPAKTVAVYDRMGYTASMNIKRREVLGQTLIDVGKYLLTTVAIGTFVTGNMPMTGTLVSVLVSLVSIFIGLMVIPGES